MQNDLTSLLRKAFSNGVDPHDEIRSAVSLKPGERRNAAVLFLDLAGFTRLSGTLDHETVHELAVSIMNELVRTAQNHHGYVDKIEGDRIMVLFGAVNSGENDSRTAVTCAFRMLEVVALAGEILGRSGVSLGARIGIGSGPLTVAPDSIGHLTAMGSTVNLSSRMEEIAELNSILVTDSVHSMCPSCARWAPSKQVAVRGFSSSVTVWKPLELLRTECESCHGTRFIGRTEEMKLLTDISAGAEASGKHALIEISGEAGSGKARLALEFLETRCADRLVLRGRAMGEGQPANWLWSSAISSFLGFQVQKAVPWNEFLDNLKGFCDPEPLKNSLPFLGNLIPSRSTDPRLTTLDNRAIALETKLAVRDFLEAVSRRWPVAVFLENTQWIDTTDLKILSFLLTNTSTEHPILFILTGGDPENESPLVRLRHSCSSYDYHGITLPELTRTQCGALAAELAERFTTGGTHQFSDHALDLLWNHSSGNPFFLRELVMHLLESGGIQQRGGVWRIVDSSVQLSRPESLTGLLQSRLDHLPEEWKKTLMICSVLGSDFLLSTFKMVCGKLDIPFSDHGVFQGLLEKQMLIERDTGEMKGYRFRHPLIQRTAYESNLSSNLSLIHRAAAEAVEELFENDEERIASKLAAHWEGAGETSNASLWGLRAQKHASDNYQHTTVLHWGEKLLRWLPEELEDHLMVLERNARAYFFTGRSDEQFATLTRMNELSRLNSMPRWRAKALMDLGSFLRTRGKISEASGHLDESLNICRSEKLEDLESNALGNLGVLAADTGNLPKARECFTMAGNIHRRLGNRKGEASTLGNLGIMLRNMRKTEEAAEKFQGALAIFQELGDTRNQAITLGNLGNIRHDLKDHATALELYTGALDIFTRIGDRRSMGIFLGNLGILHSDTGELVKAEEFFEKALAISQETGNLRSRGWILSHKAIMRLNQNSIKEADSLYRKALELFRTVEDNRMVAIVTGALGYTGYRLGNREESVSLHTKAVDMINRMKLPVDDFAHTLVLHSKLLSDSGYENIPPLPEHWKLPQ